MRLLFAVVATLGLCANASGQQLVAPGDASPYAGAATYAELVRLAVPDLAEVDGRFVGTLGAALPSLIYPDDPPIDGAQVSFASLTALPFTSEGKPHLALLLDSGDAFFMATDILVALALSDPPRLVDMADITADEHTGFGEPALLALGSGEQGILVASSHFNSSQGYKSTTVAALIDGRLTGVADVFTLRENYCGMGREQIASFASIAALSERWQPFAVTVTEVTLPLDDDCGEADKVKFGTRSAAVTYIWGEQTGLYQPDSTALDDLYAETEARF